MATSSVHPELPYEQAYIDRCYERLDDMRAAAAAMRDQVLAEGHGGTHQARFERDVIVYRAERRLEQLRLEGHSLVFGRMDLESGETWYLGRIGVSGPNSEPLVVDWRAPAAEAFYRATGREPLGLKRRRHLLCEGRRLLAIEDEEFGDDASLGLSGPGALLAALERTRTGHMRDIVATVQREQDEIIRAGVDGILVVQGGPGTGKTAVALHRAAYLLFTHRRRLDRQGVLVVGPNQVFLRYIDRVLPALGESGVALATVDDLVQDVRVRSTDPPEVARVKGEARMVTLVARAVSDRQRPLARDMEITLDEIPLRLSAGASRAIVESARSKRGPHNLRRRGVEQSVFNRLYSQYRTAEKRRRLRTGRGPDARDGPPVPMGEPLTRREFVREVRRDPEVVRALERMWPRLTGAELVHELLGTPPLIASAGRGILSGREQELLHRRMSETERDVPWTSGDAALVDEAHAHLGPPRPKPVGPDDEEEPLVRDYGHIIVDEAQTLSPMQLRMLARRSLTGSMTVVGDIAQASGPWAPETWDDVLRHLPSERGSSLRELTVNYRTPSEIMDFAGRVLAASGSTARPPSSVRSSGTRPQIIRVARPELARRAASLAASELAAVHGGTVALIVAQEHADGLAVALADTGLPFGEAARRGRLDAPVELVTMAVVSGLEFDSVIVVEPSAIVREAERGAGALYVALTRSTQRLAILHHEDLPPGLAT